MRHGSNLACSGENYCHPIYLPVDSVINILFSSGTTGKGKMVKL